MLKCSQVDVGDEARTRIVEAAFKLGAAKAGLEQLVNFASRSDDDLAHVLVQVQVEKIKQTCED